MSDVIPANQPRLRLLIQLDGQRLMTLDRCQQCGQDSIVAEGITITGNGQCMVRGVSCKNCGTPGPLFDGDGNEIRL